MEAIASNSDSISKTHLALRIWQIGCQLVLRTAALLFLPLFAKVSIEGRSRLRHIRLPVILVSNHKTYLDPLLIGLALPVFSRAYPLRFIAKDEFFSFWKGLVFRSLACIRSYYGQGLDRSLAQPQEILRSDGCLIIFPEGMMMKGEELGAPRRGVGVLAGYFPNVPIIPIGIWGANHVRLGSFLFRRPHLKVSVGKPFTVPAALRKDAAAASDFVMTRIKEEHLLAAAEDILEFRESAFSRSVHYLLKKILGPIIRFLWVEEVEGYHHLPSEGAVIVASNHHSYFDFLCFSAVSKRKVHYLAAEKFFKSALWRPLMKATGQIRVDREHHDKARMWSHVLSALEQGKVIGIFPEGTRSSDGRLGAAFTGVGRLALKSRVPVVPVGMVGTFEIMSRHDKRPRLKRAKIKIGEPLHFPELFDVQHTEEHYRLVTDKVMSKIAELAGENQVPQSHGSRNL